MSKRKDIEESIQWYRETISKLGYCKKDNELRRYYNANLQSLYAKRRKLIEDQ